MFIMTLLLCMSSYAHAKICGIVSDDIYRQTEIGKLIKIFAENHMIQTQDYQQNHTFESL